MDMVHLVIVVTDFSSLQVTKPRLASCHSGMCDNKDVIYAIFNLGDSLVIFTV